MPSLPVVLLLMLLLLACPLATGAPIVKCRGDDGSIFYQDSPCKTGIELRNFDIDSATVSVVPGSPVTTTPPPAAARHTRADPVARRSPDQKISSGKASERRFIRTGMSEAEVLRRIGKPEVDARSSRKQGKDGKHWSYLPAAGDPDTVTTLTIVGGLVANVERKIVR
jgi:hypothetical protein